MVLAGIELSQVDSLSGVLVLKTMNQQTILFITFVFYFKFQFFYTPTCFFYPHLIFTPILFCLKVGGGGERRAERHYFSTSKIVSDK